MNAEFIVADARHLQLPQRFDGAICLCEGAFGLAGDDDGHRQILRGVYQVLRPNSLFVLTTINALSVSAQNESFDAYTGTTSSRETITNSEGKSKEVEIYTTAFTYRELKLLLESSGFKVLNGYCYVAGNFSEKLLSVNDIEIMMISQQL
ncbi:class I SAM-dependent methyltransferase [Niallia sp. 03190]|uniref:class I SAM-dependent methyltransferase n=1 Tax=Niallia sp. 03190 TaxID=3458061 RepID=UPI004044A9ED